MHPYSQNEEVLDPISQTDYGEHEGRSVGEMGGNGMKGTGGENMNALLFRPC